MLQLPPSSTSISGSISETWAALLGLKRPNVGALSVLKDGAVVAVAEDLSAFAAEGDGGMGGMGEVAAARPEAWLGRAGALSAAASAAVAAGKGGDHAAAYAELQAEAEDAADAETAAECNYYDCGKAGCQKTFRHEHVSSALPVPFAMKPLPAPEPTRSSLGPAQLRPEM